MSLSLNQRTLDIKQILTFYLLASGLQHQDPFNSGTDTWSEFQKKKIGLEESDSARYYSNTIQQLWLTLLLSTASCDLKPWYRLALASGVKLKELSKLVGAVKLQLLRDIELMSQPVYALLQAAVPSWGNSSRVQELDDHALILKILE